MPTYEYHCDKCGRDFEKFQSMSDKALTTCPKDRCTLKTWGKGKVRKLISSGAGLLFKGSGFYITDYRSENYKTGAKKESGATDSGTKDSGTKDSATKDSGTKESGTKDAGAKPAPAAASGGDSKTPAAGDKKPATKSETKPAKPAK